MSPNEITNIQQLIDIVHGYSSNADIQLFRPSIPSFIFALKRATILKNRINKWMPI